ncbi:adenine deaminase [Deminuibacter soli]|uniref:Adenine deaminase n=1 Tax=Deminuibacter soli TaxID=2291815 RepID=A0A3E1NNY3_9BACT|nr:adenine deaminase [Deminuibacter soli]RFM29646.1 adenine deaminase [Deminuibacter soli]
MPNRSFSITGLFVDIFRQSIYPAIVKIDNRIIAAVERHDSLNADQLPYILPGFIDSHVHIESSMLVPSEFARLAVVHGTVATVSDPHEIANVCGMEGVQFMIDNSKTVPFKFNFGAPSCVPATGFETAGAALSSDEVAQLLQQKEIRYLSEMMNFPGVLHGDSEVMKKIHAALALGKPVDGHAPGLRGSGVKAYIEAGLGDGQVAISTDHECFTAEEALEKLGYGMKILIREGSAARNFEALAPLLHTHARRMMFCSDDKHPDSLAAGHINTLCARAVAKGIDVFNVLQAACINPVEHYQLEVGLLRQGDPADFILVKDLKDFEVLQTYINGLLVADHGRTLIASVDTPVVNNFNCQPIDAAALAVPVNSYPATNGLIPVMEALDGQLITNRLQLPGKIADGNYVSDTGNDILKIVVVNRYSPAPVAKAFIRNFGLKQGALASSIAHDSHNIVAVGTDDAAITRAVNLVIESQGGVSAVGNDVEKLLPMPVAGLMSAEDGYAVADAYTAIDALVKEQLGSRLGAPFMTLSFMALLVIPHLKLSDKGLFDGDTFSFV